MGIKGVRMGSCNNDCIYQNITTFLYRNCPDSEHGRTFEPSVAGRLKDVRAQKFPRTDFFKTLTTGRK